jgi:intracellular sulfur oxidation DsrE/DsrF family protein
MEIVMKSWLIIVAAAAASVGLASPLLAQSTHTLPVPNIEAARDVPGAHELPDPTVTHKVVIDIAAAATEIGDVNPWLTGAARYVNTLAKYGVPADHRKIAVVLHQGSTEIILNNETFKARNDGHDNPNVALIQNLAAAGVEFHVCGQAVLGRDIDPETIMPEIQLDLWALTTLINLQLEGYVLVGG